MAELEALPEGLEGEDEAWAAMPEVGAWRHVSGGRNTLYMPAPGLPPAVAPRSPAKVQAWRLPIAVGPQPCT